MSVDFTSQLRIFIKTEANRLGFTHIGFTAPVPSPNIHYYLDWIQNDYHADMQYLANKVRLDKIHDPTLIMPSCQTIIVFALPYQPAQISKNNQQDIGQVASYAIGPDYHVVIPGLLEELIQNVKNEFPSLNPEYKIYTDTGPIMEKDLAQRAGLGWIGKNGCLIIPGHGSYFLLAELLIDIRLTPDPPFSRDLCGNCRACIDICPTQCIMENRTLDAKNCISYQTIENKSIIPKENRSKHQQWVFGCDICQIVCPWNQRFAVPPEHDLFPPMDQFPIIELDQVLILSPQDFNKKFKSHPIKRAKRRGYFRNLCVVIGNAQSEQYIPFVVELLNNESDPIILRHAAWALHEIDPKFAKPHLLEILQNADDESLRQEIKELLGQPPGQPGID